MGTERSAPPRPFRMRPHRRDHGRRVVCLVLFAVALVTSGCGEEQRRERAIARVRQLGGYYARGEPTYPSWTQEVRSVTGNRPFARLAIPPHYVRVDLWYKNATDDDMALIASLTDLTQLDLSGTKITDRGLAPLAGLARLNSLELGGTDVTDAGLVHLKGLTQLGRLRLDHCDITDAAIPHLQAIPSPDMYVHLRGTKVTSIRGRELLVRTAQGRGDVRVGDAVVVTGSYSVTEADYTPDDFDVLVLRNREDSDEAEVVARVACQPAPRAGFKGVFDFRAEFPAPNRPGPVRIETITFSKIHRLKAFYTTGYRRVMVLPARATPPADSRQTEEGVRLPAPRIKPGPSRSAEG